MSEPEYETRQEAADRRTFLGWCLLGAAALTFLITFTLAASACVANDRAKNNEMAKICVQQGGSWVYDSCIQGRKTG